MNYAWVILLVSSISLLILIVLKTRGWARLLKYAALNLVIAGFALYFLRLTDIEALQLAVNPYTVFTIGILGIPGLLLLIGMNYTLF
ncbi:pro-sigmaK processing inhibitor BofA family protein [Paenibacillus gansuensis]|uniref:Pro-sigmaK processing inhibitor BofA family protein n=1 Tax=Paenibacillus gansuensis TaxID=306542 RepID=A0ABW5PH39_9BACL